MPLPRALLIKLKSEYDLLLAVLEDEIADCNDSIRKLKLRKKADNIRYWFNKTSDALARTW